MTENGKNVRKNSARAEIDELKAEIHELKQTVVAMRTQMQQIMSVIYPPVVEPEVRQKFR